METLDLKVLEYENDDALNTNGFSLSRCDYYNL